MILTKARKIHQETNKAYMKTVAAKNELELQQVRAHRETTKARREAAAGR